MILISSLAFILGLHPANGEAPFLPITVDGHTAYITQNLSEQSDACLAIKSGTPRPKAITGFWVPTLEQVQASEPVILGYLKWAEKNTSKVFPWAIKDEKERREVMANAQLYISLVRVDYDLYQRQYTGIVMDGRRLIVCNFFYRGQLGEEFGPDPVTRYVQVNDGGHCYWQVYYDLKKKTCSDLSINGPWEPGQKSIKSILAAPH